MSPFYREAELAEGDLPEESSRSNTKFMYVCCHSSAFAGSFAYSSHIEYHSSRLIWNGICDRVMHTYARIRAYVRFRWACRALLCTRARVFSVLNFNREISRNIPFRLPSWNANIHRQMPHVHAHNIREIILEALKRFKRENIFKNR